MDAQNERDFGGIDRTVSCSRCEAVCCRLTVVLMPEDRVPRWLVAHDERGFETLAKSEDGWCAAVDPISFRCGIYEDRPAVCRKFAMGSPGCRDERSRWSQAHALPTPVMTYAGITPEVPSVTARGTRLQCEEPKELGLVPSRSR